MVISFSFLSERSHDRAYDVSVPRRGFSLFYRTKYLGKSRWASEWAANRAEGPNDRGHDGGITGHLVAPKA